MKASLVLFNGINPRTYLCVCCCYCRSCTYGNFLLVHLFSSVFYIAYCFLTNPYRSIDRLRLCSYNGCIACIVPWVLVVTFLFLSTRDIASFVVYQLRLVRSIIIGNLLLWFEGR